MPRVTSICFHPDTWMPSQQSAEDVRYFDPEFTTQTPKDSYVEVRLETMLLIEWEVLKFLRLLTGSNAGGIKAAPL